MPQNERQHPPFQPGNEFGAKPGNELSVRHGAFSPRRVDPVAAELVEAVLADPDLAYLRAAKWRPALWAWARAEAQCQLVDAYLAAKAEAAGDGVGDLTDERVRSAYPLLHQAEARATTGRTRLGLDPLSASRLGRNVAAQAVDVARLMGDLEREERERAQRDGDQEDGDDG